jgi:hypothetical protein
MVADTNEAASTLGWLGTSWRAVVASALRNAASLLNDLADWVDGGERPRVAALYAVPRDTDGPRPMEGTRERIADALGRARSRYETVTAPGDVKRNGRAGKPPSPRRK